MNKEDVIAQLKKEYPHGHPNFIPLLVNAMELHSKKNHEYALGGDPLGNFKRVGNILSNYPDLNPADPVVVCITYKLKQLDAVLWQLCQGYEGDIEGKVSRSLDDFVYSGIETLLLQE